MCNPRVLSIKSAVYLTHVASLEQLGMCLPALLKGNWTKHYKCSNIGHEKITKGYKTIEKAKKWLYIKHFNL